MNHHDRLRRRIAIGIGCGFGSSLAPLGSGGLFAATRARRAAGDGQARRADGARQGFADREDVRAFVAEMTSRHGFLERELDFLFSRAVRQEAVLRAIRPGPEKQRSWVAYRAGFVNPGHVEAGLGFWRANRETLERARREHGVPEEVILAIIGVESFYGRNAGRWRVIDALATLAFDYPPRSEFFRSELEQFLLLSRDQDVDVFSVQGSYAGAIGMAQFMPGSIRRFGVDFDGDGRADLRTSTMDAIGSVANYLQAHGWRTGETALIPARVTGQEHREMLAAGIQPGIPLSDLRRFGVETRSDLPLETLVALVELPTPERPTEYRLGLNNFYVITRYNRSTFYACSVNDLGEALREARNRG